MILTDTAGTEQQRAADADVGGAVKAMFGRGSLYVGVWTFQPLAALFGTPIVTRLLGTDSFGSAAACIVLMPVIAAILILGMDFAIQRFYVEEGGEDRTRALMLVMLFLTSIGVALLILSAPLWSKSLGFSTDALRLTIGWAGLAAFNRVQLAFLRSQDRFRAFALTSSMQAFGAQLCGVAFILITTRSAIAYLAGLTAGQAAAVCLGLVFAPPAASGLKPVKKSMEAFRYGLPLVPYTLSSFLLNAGGRLVVLNYLGHVAVARYQVTYNASCMLIMLLSAVDLSWEPRLFAIKDDDVRWRVLAHLRDGIYTLLLPLCLSMALVVPAVLRVYVPPGYHAYDLTKVVAMVVLAAVPFAGYCANMRVLLWFKQSSSLAAVTMGTAIASIGLNVILVPAIGITGSALSTLVSYGILWFVSGVIARRRAIFPRPARKAQAMVLLTVLGVSLAVAVPTSPVWLFSRGALGVGLGLVSIHLLRKLIRGETTNAFVSAMSSGRRRNGLGRHRTGVGGTPAKFSDGGEV